MLEYRSFKLILTSPSRLSLSNPITSAGTENEKICIIQRLSLSKEILENLFENYFDHFAISFSVFDKEIILASMYSCTNTNLAPILDYNQSTYFDLQNKFLANIILLFCCVYLSVINSIQSIHFSCNICIAELCI